MCALIGVVVAGCTMQAQQAAPAVTPKAGVVYYTDCNSAVAGGDGSVQRPLQTVAAVNALALRPGDSLLLKRGTVCHGALKPQGSGIEKLPLRLAAYGEGDLPRVEAADSDEAALELHDQEFWEISQIDLKGGTGYGIFIKSETKVLHHLYLRDLRVHDVRGPLVRKASGLVVMTAASAEPTVGLNDVQVDGVMAYRTTLWSGIFVERATHVKISNSMVHDVQGDGIVVFGASDALIEHSVAWHTGMQHQESIGTPNAIWTWTCTDCMVRDNEAFLTDSPGVDGGSFDIDFANMRNSVQGNFGHDTVGYCVSVFGAFGPTVDSVVADNLCLRNGLSPRLAQRQGALLLMTWQGGTLDGVDIHGNRVEWDPPGQTPLLQIGSELKAEHVLLRKNDLESSGISFVNPRLKYSGTGNQFRVTGDATSLGTAKSMLAELPEAGASVTAKESALMVYAPAKTSHAAHGWRLALVYTGAENNDLDTFRAAMVAIKSAAMQFGPLGLRVTVSADQQRLALAHDMIAADTKIVLQPMKTFRRKGFYVELTAPSGRVVRSWHTCPGPTDLGSTLWQRFGPPDFSHLGLEDVPALP